MYCLHFLSFRRSCIQDLIVTDPIYIRFLYPMSSISLSASIFMTVSVTVERYWAVCKPAVRHYSKRKINFRFPFTFISTTDWCCNAGISVLTHATKVFSPFEPPNTALYQYHPYCPVLTYWPCTCLVPLSSTNPLPLITRSVQHSSRHHLIHFRLFFILFRITWLRNSGL